MSATISKESKDFVVITIKGVFMYQDMKAIEDTAQDILPIGDKINCLILAEKFTGWGKDGDWGDLSFMYKNDQFIGKIAIVADEKRRDEFLMFLGAGRRQAIVRFFCSDEQGKARSWLAEPAE